MAIKVAAATGNWSAAATWNSVTNVPTINITTTNITVTTANFFSQTFTAPNLVNACTGVLIYLVSTSYNNITVTLQESTVDTAAATTFTPATVTQLGIANAAPLLVWVKFATPYVFTTTGAGAYRFKITSSSGSFLAIADGGGANFAYLATDDRTGVPAATDDVYITGSNATNTITVTMDGTQTIGSGTDTTTVATSCRSVGFAVQIGDHGILAWDQAADATLTVKGFLGITNQGELNMGTVASPMPAARLAKLRFNENSVSGQWGINCVGSNARLILQGTAKSSTTLWKAKYVSGTGTAASPLVVDTAVSWVVGDEILVGAASTRSTNYNETESRFIITVNSPTSYVISTSKGGAEAALTFSKTTDAWVLNVERNVLIDSTTTTHSWYILAQAEVDGDVDYDWARFETTGIATTSARFGIQFAQGAGDIGNCDYCVGYRALYNSFAWTGYGGSAQTTAQRTHTGLIACYQNTASNVGAISPTNGSNSLIFVDCFAMGNNRRGFEISTGAIHSMTLTRCIAVGNATAGSASNGGFWFANTVNSTLTDCESHCNFSCGILLNGLTDSTLTNFLCGTKGANQTTDVLCVNTGTYNTVLFTNGNFGSTTLIGSYTSNINGSLIRFHKLNQTTNNHVWYTKYGSARSTGATLVDTTVRTAGGLGVRIAPEDNTTGFSWKFRILAKASSIVSFFGYFQKNVAFGTSTAKVELFLPGTDPDTGTADSTQTLTNVTGTWQAVVLSANYTGTTDEPAIIKVTGITATAAAYLYADDFYNAGLTNKLAGLDTWYQGQPVDFIPDTTFDPASVWSYAIANLTVAGTTGNQLKRTLTVGTFEALK